MAEMHQNRPFFANNQRGRGNGSRGAGGRGKRGGRGGRGGKPNSPVANNSPNDSSRFSVRSRSYDSETGRSPPLVQNPSLLEEIKQVIVNQFDSTRAELKADVSNAFNSCHSFMEKNNSWKKGFFSVKSDRDESLKKLEDIKASFTFQLANYKDLNAELQEQNSELMKNLEESKIQLIEWGQRNTKLIAEKAELAEENVKLKKTVQELNVKIDKIKSMMDQSSRDEDEPAVYQDAETFYADMTVIDQEVETVDEDKSVVDQEAETVDEIQPAIDQKAETVDENQPAVDQKAETVDENQPAVDQKAETVDEDKPAVDQKAESLDTVAKEEHHEGSNSSDSD